MKDQKKMGVLIQYVNIVLNMAISIFFTPFLIHSLGNAEYGLYRIVQSFAGQLGIMSFGISTLVSRNIVRYNTLKEEKEKQNFLAMAEIITAVLVVLTLLVGWILSFSIDTLFDSSLSIEERVVARKLYWILILNIALSIMNDYAGGIIVGHEKFVIKNGTSTIKHLFRVGILICLLQMGAGSLAIVLVDLCLSIIVFIFYIIYGHYKLKERPHCYYLDKKELRVALTFSFAILLQAIINQVNQNMDSVILGALTSPETVAVYSVALNLFTVFNSITLVIGTVFTPQATRLIMKKATGEQLTDFVIKPGRLQFMMGSLIITGFILFGKAFIKYWVGEDFYGAYRVAIILMIPAIIPLIQNVTNSILDAMMKRLGRSIILFVMAIINVLSSILFVRKFGYIGAAYGTALSFLFGNIILVNIYLAKVTSLNLKRMYSELIAKSVIVAFVCPIVCYPFVNIGKDTLLGLLIKIVLYSVIYIGSMYIFAMRDYERNLIRNPVKKILYGKK